MWRWESYSSPRNRFCNTHGSTLSLGDNDCLGTTLADVVKDPEWPPSCQYPATGTKLKTKNCPRQTCGDGASVQWQERPRPLTACPEDQDPQSWTKGTGLPLDSGKGQQNGHPLPHHQEFAQSELVKPHLWGAGRTGFCQDKHPEEGEGDASVINQCHRRQHLWVWPESSPGYGEKFLRLLPLRTRSSKDDSSTLTWPRSGLASRPENTALSNATKPLIDIIDTTTCAQVIFTPSPDKGVFVCSPSQVLILLNYSRERGEHQPSPAGVKWGSLFPGGPSVPSPTPQSSQSPWPQETAFREHREVTKRLDFVFLMVCSSVFSPWWRQLLGGRTVLSSTWPGIPTLLEEQHSLCSLPRDAKGNTHIKEENTPPSSPTHHRESQAPKIHLRADSERFSHSVI